MNKLIIVFCFFSILFFCFCGKEEIGNYGPEYANKWNKKITKVDQEIKTVKKWKRIGKPEKTDLLSGLNWKNLFIADDSSWFKIVYEPVYRYLLRKEDTDVFYNSDNTICKFIFRNTKRVVYNFLEKESGREFRVIIEKDEENKKIFMTITDVSKDAVYKYVKYLEPPWQISKE